MPAYAIVILDTITDPAGLQVYSGKAQQSMTEGLELITAYGQIEVLEGAAPDGVVMLRFPNMADALAWYRSDAYQLALPLRKAAAACRVLLIDGAA